MFRIDNILGRMQPVKVEQPEIRLAVETDVQLDRQHMEMWRDGDMSFTDLLKGLMGVSVSDDQLKEEFS